MASTGQYLISIDDPDEWDKALRKVPHAFAHTSSSCLAMRMTTGWPTYLYVRDEGRVRDVCAIAERGGAGVVDVVTPYGFGGFVSDGGSAEELLAAWHDFARRREYVSGYIGLNPLLAPHSLRESSDYAEHNELFVLRLDRGMQALHADLSTNRRRQLRQFADGRQRLVDQQERVWPYFLRNVDDFLRRSGASRTYAFAMATWESLIAGNNVFCIGVEEDDGEISAASLFAYTPFGGEYLFGVSSPRGRGHSAALIWEAATRMGHRGIPWLNLGGGVRPGDGIADFKQRFGGERLPMGALKQVYRPEMHARLCRGVGRNADDRSGFFPPYRAPQPLVEL